MQLLQSSAALVKSSVNGGSDCQGSPNDRANAGQEARKRLWSSLSIYDLHGADIIREEDAWNTTMGMQAFFVAFGGVTASAQRPFM